MTDQITYGRRRAPIHAAANSAAVRTDTILVCLSKAAAALFALGLTYFLSGQFLVHATEPKPLGGMYIDKMPDPFMPWTPVYYPLILAAVFAWWRWPRKTIKLGAWGLLRGGFVMAQIGVFCIFASFLCVYIGKFILAIPFVLGGDLFKSLLSSIGAAASMTIGYTTFFAALLFPISIAFGLILAVVTQSARNRLASGAMQGTGNAYAGTVDITENAHRNDVRLYETAGKRLAVSWPSILAAGFVAVFLLLSFHRMGPFILALWAHALISAAIPCLIIGGVFRWLEFRWAVCVVAGEILSWYFGYDSMQWNGLLIGQIISVPPAIGATLAGYWIVNAFQLRRRQRSV